MSRVVAQALALMAIYLLVMTSAKPGDAAAGFLLGLAVAVALRAEPAARRAVVPGRTGLVGLGQVLATTAVEMARGSWRTALFCLRGGARAGFVEIPRGSRSAQAVALWGVITGEAPDEVPVDIDEERGVLIVHVIDASDPDGVRERHERAYERAQSKLVA